jgi:hypothetical protein
MSFEAVYGLFSASLHPDAQARRQSEDSLGQIAGNPGFLPLLSQLIRSPPQQEPHVQQAMVIFLKNRILRFWDCSEDSPNKILDQDKDFIRKNIFVLIDSAEPRVRVQLFSALRTIVRNDFPSVWPSLPNEISVLLQGANLNTGLIALLHLISKHHYEDESVRESVIQHSFPMILQIASNSLQQGHWEAVKIVFKTFLNAFVFTLPNFAQSSQFLGPWMEIFMQALLVPCPVEFQFNQDEEDSEKAKSFFWKMKKWVAHCINKIFCRYVSASEEYTSVKTVSGFKKAFVSSYGVKCLELYLSLLSRHCTSGEKQAMISPRIICLICDFLCSAIKPKKTWEIMQNHLEMLITHFVFSQVCFSDKDQSLWDEDPLEYVRVRIDPFQEAFSPISSATCLLSDLARTRKRKIFNSILSFINSILMNYLQSALESRNPRQKDGALYMVGALADIIQESPLQDQMESFLAMHVIPELASPHAFLRARACWIFQNFDFVTFSNNENILLAWQYISKCIQEKDLPVKIEAALSLGTFLQYEVVKEAARPSAVALLQILMNLTSESHSDSISYIMDKIVNYFPTELLPYSVNIVGQIRDNIIKALEGYTNETAVPVEAFETVEEDFDAMAGSDKISMIMGLFKTIITIIESIKANSELLAQVDQIMAPLIGLILQQQVIDLYEDSFDYLETVTYNLKQISPSMWNIFEAAYVAFKGNASDYLAEMAAFFDNVISYGAEAFFSNSKWQSMILEIIQFTIYNDEFGENDRVYACKLIESILLNCKGRIDNLLPMLVNIGVQMLREGPKTTSGKVHFSQILINCIYYNAQATISQLESIDGTMIFFSSWLDYIPLFKRVHDKKLCVLAINEILKSPFSAMPPTIQNGYSKLMVVAATMLETLPAAYEERKKQEEEFENGNADDADFPFDASANYDDDDEEEDAEYEETENSTSQIDETEYLGYDDDSDSEWFGELEEEIFFQTPIDSIDPFEQLRGTLTYLQANSPNLCAILMQDLDKGRQEKLAHSLTLSQVHFQRAKKI